jgi:hypothetical protein
MCVILFLASSVHAAGLQAGAAVVDVTPEQFPVLVNGGMLSRSASKVKTPVNARAIVLDDGQGRVAIVVVDSCMLNRTLLDDVKALTEKQVGIRRDRILISATHTHSAPAGMGCLGTSVDELYVPYLRMKLVEAIETAAKNLEPAQVGWGGVNAAEYTAPRRWIRRPDRLAEDPFGNPTVRANMHAGRNWDDVTGEAGPEDPDLSLISIRSVEGRPIAVLANFSMHYFSDEAISADYFGLFCEGLKERLAAKSEDGTPPFVGIMSHGCSGDIWRRDYTKPPEEQGQDITIDAYAQALVGLAESALRDIEYSDGVPLRMQETRLPMNYRVPDKQRLEWAQRVVAEMGDRLPKDTTEVYAREQVLLDEWQSTEVVVQGIRIGDIGIATTPCETYALTGLKIKASSPLEKTIVIELANGGDGYIPPPEQHRLGGYNTWAARSAGLEVEAEPRITAAAIRMLEEVAEKPRRDARLPHGPGAEAILALEPVAYWRLNESAGPRAEDSSEHACDAIYEPGVVYFLEGPASAHFCSEGATNRAAHFAGGRVQSRLRELGDQYTVSLWIWNGLPLDAREIAGWFVSRGHDRTLSRTGDHFGVVGRGPDAGKLTFRSGEVSAVGKTPVERWRWTHVAVIRDGEKVRVHMNGAETPEIEASAPAAGIELIDTLFIGGRCDNDSNWEGRLDEVALFDRALDAEALASLAAGVSKRRPAEAMSASDIAAGLESHDRALFIKTGWIRDPYITRGPDEQFYLTGTTPLPGDPREQTDPYNIGLWEESIVGWKMQAWRSPDLIHWESLGTPFTLEDGIWFESRPQRFEQVDESQWRLWAPELHWLGDRWAMVHTSPSPVKGANLALTQGSQLKGPWLHPMGTDIGRRHDPSLFQDEDDQWWMIWGATEIAPLNEDFSGFAAEPTPIGPSGETAKMGHEGCLMQKIGGKYVLFGTGWSTGEMRKGSYNLYYATADKITGPYSERKFAGRFLGHGTPFRDAQGRWWCTAFYNGNVPPLPSEDIQSQDLGETAQTINEQGVTIVPLDVRIGEDGDVAIRAEDPRYATPGPDEKQEFSL